MRQNEKRGYLSTVLRIAVPVALQSMLQSSFSIVDQLMVGRLGSEAIAAVEIAGKPSFVLSFVTGAVAAICGIQVSQYIGKKDKDAADRSVTVNLMVALLLSAVFFALCLVIPEKICGIFSDDTAVISTAASYLSVSAWTYLPAAVSAITGVRIRCMDKASYTLYVGIVAAVSNTLLNWVLIFGHFGLPAGGVRGAAIASVISTYLAMFLMVLVYWKVAGRPRFSLALGRDGYRQYLAMLLSVVLNEFLWSVGQNVNTYIYGHLGTKELAAMSLTGPVQGLLIGALSGLSQAAGILIGKRLGEERFTDAYTESKLLMWYGFLASLVLSVLLILLHTPYTRLFNVEPEVQRTAGALLLAFAILAPVKVANMILGGGIIRSGGRTLYIMAIDLAGTWLVGVPIGFLTAFVFHLPIVWVYFLLSQEELVRFLITLVVFRRKRWMQSL